jgi:hypothetical protein
MLMVMLNYVGQEADGMLNYVVQDSYGYVTAIATPNGVGFGQ